MKILVFSDTHGNIDNAEYAVLLNAPVDIIIHLGDYYRDALRLGQLFPEIPVEYVSGNCDFTYGDVQPEKLIEIDGVRILLTHGHNYGVKSSFNILFRKASELDVKLVLFGHTHFKYMESRGDITILNPGSTSSPRGRAGKSYAVVTTDGKSFRAELADI